MYNDKYSNCWCTVHTHTQIVFWCCELCANRWLQSGCFCCCWFFYDSSKSETCVQSFTWKFSRFSCQLASLCLCLCVHVFFIFFSNQTSFFLFHCIFATLFVFVFVFLLLAGCLHFLCSQCVLCDVCAGTHAIRYIRLFLISLWYRTITMIGKSKNKTSISMDSRRMNVLILE